MKCAFDFVGRVAAAVGVIIIYISGCSWTDVLD